MSQIWNSSAIKGFLHKKQFKGCSTIACSNMETLSDQWEKENNIQQNSEKNGVRKDPHQIEMCEEKQ
jgi:ribonuclease HIII